MIFLICVFTVVTRSASGVLIEETSSWYVDPTHNRMDAKFSIPVASSISEWNVKLTFTKPTTDLLLWQGVKECNDTNGYWYIIKNRPEGHYYWDVFHTALAMPFHVTFGGSSPIGPGNEAVLVGTDACADADGGTTVGNGGTTDSTVAPPSYDAPINLVCTDAVAGSGPYDYSEVIAKSILFYEAQRSGKLPANNRLAWRKDSATNDKGIDGEPLDGGWYDAGDYVKFGFPMAGSVTALTWGLVNWKDAYVASCQLELMYESIKWPLDYFIKAHDPSKNRFYVQVGNGTLDHNYWGRPEEMAMERPAFFVDPSKPGTEPAAETAAAMAAGSMAFVEKDAQYSATLLQHARQLFTFAETYQGDYTVSVPDVAAYYPSYSGYNDELAWAAAWLYYATNETQYKVKAEAKLSSVGFLSEFSWDEKTIGAVALMFHITKDPSYRTILQSFLTYWKDNVYKTPQGLAWYIKWGSLRYAANAALIALVAADNGIDKQANIDWAKKQIHYALGDTGRSFVVGFGKNPPQRPHHASSSCPLTGTCDWGMYSSPDPNHQVLYGALVGGPDKYDSYTDLRTDYYMNEVTCDYNAGFQSAVAGLKHFQMQGLV